jgi:hypothetical protein
MPIPPATSVETVLRSVESVQAQSVYLKLISSVTKIETVMLTIEKPIKGASRLSIQPIKAIIFFTSSPTSELACSVLYNVPKNSKCLLH